MQAPILALRVLGKLSHLHKVRACFTAPATWGDQPVVQCTSQNENGVHKLSLEYAATLMCGELQISTAPHVQ